MRIAGLFVALAFLTSGLTACGGAEANRVEVTVYKTPTCGCCGKWVEHLERAGFAVATIEVKQTREVRAMNGVPEDLASCHTALVEGYVVEGHVPAEDILRLLKERPKISGLAVPGMPIGSPGMEGRNPQRYQVFAFNEHGGRETYASHGP